MNPAALGRRSSAVVAALVLVAWPRSSSIFVHRGLAVFWIVAVVVRSSAAIWAVNTILSDRPMSSYGLGLLVILFFFGLAGGIVGRIKGSSFSMWFLVSFCVPFIGLLTAVLYR